jgi:hypothetical protein
MRRAAALSCHCRDDGYVTLAAAVAPGHRLRSPIFPAGEFVRQYGQPIGTSLGYRFGRMDHTRQYVGRRACRSRSFLRTSTILHPIIFPRIRSTRSKVFAARWTRRHAQFRIDRSDVDVRQPRSDADLDDVGVHALQPRENFRMSTALSRSRITRDAAVRTDRLST